MKTIQRTNVDLQKLLAKGLRQCSRCKKILSLTMFYKDNTHPGGNGYQRTCKICQRDQRTDQRTTKKERYVHTEINYRCVKRWRKTFPERLAAHNAVARALRKGTLVRPNLCQNCGEPKYLEAHHDDYYKKLDVRWLCRSCHAAHHRIYPDTAIPFMAFNKEKREWEEFLDNNSKINDTDELELTNRQAKGDVSFP